jgi:hypothetical protein
MEPNEVVQANYQIASQQFVSRVQMRDNVVLVFLAGAGTVMSISFGAGIRSEILLAIPYLAFGCTLLIVHHNVMLGALLEYCSSEMTSILEGIEEEHSIPRFETSQSLRSYFPLILGLRTWSQFLIVFLPCFFALAMNATASISGGVLKATIWWFAAACTAISLGFVLGVHRQQKKQIAILGPEHGRARRQPPNPTAPADQKASLPGR